ncbi:hypothetical protein Q31b_32960 [Novipirellula aureliae]|uniref:Phd_YefM n=1 Tax=Novipirellula aureliae TaxID=2527966 RepID=A0A5C6DTD1_9BACT|nr:hypothetical protein Q31b_32960 [Novipirellula aureliae]
MAGSPHARLTVVDPSTQIRYVLISAEEYARLEDLDAIRRGIACMEAGEGQPLHEVRNMIHNR